MEFVTSHLFRNAGEFPEKPAICTYDSVVSYGELAAYVYGVSRALTELGLKAGDVVLQMAVPNALYAETCYGIHLLGAVHVPAENRIPADRMTEIAERVGANLIVCPADPGCGVAHITHEALHALAAKYAAEWTPETELELPDGSGCGEILFTTGSTGRSKGVMQSRNSVAAYTATINAAVGVKQSSTLLVCTPLNHAGGLHRMHMLLQAGGTLVMMDGLKDLRRYYENVRKYDVNALYLPPAGVHILLTFSAKELAKLDEKLDFVFTASAPFGNADKEKLCSVLPTTRLLEAYGSSETGSVCCYNYNTSVSKPGCVGKPYDCVTVRLDGEDGKISVKSPMLMLGYLGDPELTATVYDGEWFHTTDCGVIDEDGCLIFKGRADDVINIGGMKVAPSEVEEVASKCSGVADCGCTSVENAITGTQLKLLVCMKEGAVFDPRALVAEMKPFVEPYKLPSIVKSVSAIPRFPNGKIDRKKLKDI